jgi:hypothetical protein
MARRNRKDAILFVYGAIARRIAVCTRGDRLAALLGQGCDRG